jgi:glucosaminylphosphatidylinositol acyltransferase
MYGLFLVDAYIVVLDHIPVLFQSVNRNQLALFLISNLMTGGVNLSVDTLSYSNGQALFVLFTYMFLAGTVSIVWNELDITIKL